MEIFPRNSWDNHKQVFFINFCLKYLEDETLYEKITNWQKYSNYLKKILPQELGLGINRNLIKKWHLNLAEYFKHKPTDLSRKNFISNGLGFKDTSLINRFLTIFRKNKEILELIEEMYRYF